MPHGGVGLLGNDRLLQSWSQVRILKKALDFIQLQTQGSKHINKVADIDATWNFKRKKCILI